MAAVAEKDAVAVVVEKDVAEVVVEKVVAEEEGEGEEGTRSSKCPNQYWRHPCEYHRLCV